MLRAPRAHLTVFRVFLAMRISCVARRSRLFRSGAALSSLTAVLTGCASLPSSGPTGIEVRHAAVPKPGQYPFTLIEVQTTAALPAQPPVPTSALLAMPPRPTDLLGPGDVLSISVYEAGVSLFGTALRTVAAGGMGGVDTSSTSERLPPVRVDDYG
jgi:polysaccharide biosynthesis/export protein